MSDFNITQALRQSMKNYPRTRGRYNSSELFFINNGSTTPENWLNPPERRTKELLDMWAGRGMHTQLENLLGLQYSEKKKEIVYKGIVLVAKGDFFPPHLVDEVWEFKTSEKKMKTAKPWHEHQARLYCSMFDKKKGVIYQPVQDDNGLYLKELGRVDRDDKWFEQELEKLYQFHLEIEKLWK